MPTESSVLVRLRLLGGARFAAEAKTAGRGLNTIGRDGGRVSTKLAGVNRALGATAMALRTVGVGAAIGAGSGLAYGVKTAANFEQSMANVQARLLTTRSVMAQLEEQAIKLGAGTAFSAQQAADAMGEFAAAGFSASEIMRVMPGTLDLAAAAGTDLAFAAETSGAIIRQFGLNANDAGHVADVMTVAVNKSAISMEDLALSMKYVGPVAGRFNQSLEDIGAATAILGNVGIKGETAGTTLRRALVNIVKPSIKTQKVLKEVGVSTDEFSKASVDAKGRLRGLPQILGNLSKHFAGLAAPDRRRVLAQLFGVEALPGMVTLFDMGEKRIRAMSQQLLNSGGAAKRTAGIMRGTVKGAWDEFTGSVETAAIKLTRRFNPAIRNALKGAAGLVTKASSALAGGGPAPVAVGERASGNAAERAGGASKGASKLREALGGVVSWASANLPKVGQALMTAGAQLVDAFKPAAPFLQNVLLPLLKGLAIGVIGGVVGAFKVAVVVIKGVAIALGFIGRLAAPLKPIFVGIGAVVGLLFGGVILRALGALRYFGVLFRLLAIPIRVAVGALGIAIRVVGRVWTAFTKALTGVQRFVGTFASAPARVIRAALNIVGGVINTIQRLPGRILALAKRVGSNLISGIANAVRSTLPRLASTLADAGRSIVRWLTDAIKNAPGAIANALLSIVPGPVKGAVKKALGLAGLASGGTVRQGGLAIVGERGPELAALPGGTTVYDAPTTRRARAALATPAPTYVVANLHLSGRQIHSEVFRVDRQLSEAT